MKKLILTVLILYFAAVSISAENNEKISIQFNNVSIKDVLSALAEKLKINLIIPDELNKNISINLYNVEPLEGIKQILSNTGFTLKKEKNIYRIVPDTDENENNNIINIINDSLITLDVKNMDVKDFLREITEITEKNIIYSPSINGSITAFLKEMPFEKGVDLALKTNNFDLIKHKDYLEVVIKEKENKNQNNSSDYNRNSQRYSSSGKGKVFTEFKNNKFNIDIQNGDLQNVIYEIMEKSKINAVITEIPSGSVTAKIKNITLEDCLTSILKGTDYSYYKENNIYYFGKTASKDIVGSLLIPLKHLSAENAFALIPNSYKKNIEIQIIKEHNGLMITADENSIKKIRDFITQIDFKVSQVEIKALIIDFKGTDDFELSLQGFQGDDHPNHKDYYETFYPDLNFQGRGDFLNEKFNLTGITKLPEDFYLRLKMLEQENKINIKATPQITTLSGHEAKIEVGWTGYYKLKTEVPVGDNVRISEKIHTFNAGIILTITPWITQSGEIIAKIEPEISSPTYTGDSDQLPQIDKRLITTNVSLKDGETIILGGLIQTTDTETYEGVPILSRIPVIGELFKNRVTTKNKNNLVIYITPRIIGESENIIIPEEHKPKE